ncbi:unnamed protein product [Caenorhabditis nigoni]
MIMDKSVELDQATKAIVKMILMRSLLKAKRDYRHAKKEKLEVIYDEDKEQNPVERCFNVKCKAELFNFIPLVPAKDIPEEMRSTRTLMSILQSRILRRTPTVLDACQPKTFLKNLKVYQHHSFETLPAAYDKFKNFTFLFK